MTRGFNAGVLAALISIAYPASATQKADKIAIDPDGKRSAIILRSENLPVPSFNYQSAWKLNFEVFDPDNQSMKGGFLSGQEVLSSKPNLFVDGFLVMDLKPGTYVIRDFSRQDYWGACFHDNRVQFTIKPGEILYLGAFDAMKHVSELTSNVVRSGSGTMYGTKFVHYFDNISPPAFAPVDDQGLSEAAAMVKARMPKTTSVPVAVTFRPARFGTGSDAFGLNRVCGGYYNGSAKPAKAPATN